MHEISLAESMLQIIEQAARQDGFGRVLTVQLELGELAAVDAQALVFCFEAVARGSLAEGARLDICCVPGQGRCTACGALAPVHELWAVCPVCQSGPLVIVDGAQMRVTHVDVTPVPAPASASGGVIGTD